MEGELRGRIREMRQLAVEVTSDELLEYGREAAEARRRVIELEVDKKEYDDTIKGQIAEQQKRIYDLLSRFENSTRPEAVECEVRFHEPRKGQKTVVRLDTGEAFAIEPMHANELEDTEPLPGTSTVLTGLKESLAAIPVADMNHESVREALISLWPRELHRKMVAAHLLEGIDQDGPIDVTQFECADDLLKASRAGLKTFDFDPRKGSAAEMYQTLLALFGKNYTDAEAGRIAFEVWKYMADLWVRDFDALVWEWSEYRNQNDWQTAGIQAERARVEGSGLILDEMDPDQRETAEAVMRRWDDMQAKEQVTESALQNWLDDWTYGYPALVLELERTDEKGRLKPEWLAANGYAVVTDAQDSTPDGDDDSGPDEDPDVSGEEPEAA